jgi:tetratricopeptide (TPR) repeat protein
MGFEAQSEETPLTPEQQEQLKAVALARAPNELAAADSAKTDDELFYALPSAAMGAYLLGKHERAKALAEKALQLAPSYQRNWNYGNALHFAHSVRGLLALDNGDVSVAVDELKNAGATPGSPQLDSFGPTMQLARRLLCVGESEAVLGYFEQCRSFWKTGGVWLDLWEGKVREGNVPNFFMHAYR